MKDIDLQAERAAFEAWFKEKSPVCGINAKLAARDAWLARAAVEADMAQRVPDGWKPASGMTAHRAAFFMERFKREEKLLGPNEQAAIDFVLAMLASTPAQPAQQEPVTWHSPHNTESVPGLVWLLEKGAVFLGYHFEQPFREYRDPDGFYVGQQDYESYWARYEDGEPCEPDGWCELRPPAQPSIDTLYLLRRLLSNQHTLSGPEFRKELTKIVEAAYSAAPAAQHQEPPQPVERKPMTDAEIEDLCGEANRGFCIELEDYKKAVRDTERHHGIKE